MKKASIAITFLTLISCSEPEISGCVLDLFGNPIEGVIVSIENTQFEAETNNIGEYGLSYVPGDLNLNYKKAGFTEENINIEIHQKEDFPAKEITLYKIPKEHGLYFLDSTNAAYIPLKASDFESNTEFIETVKSYFMNSVISSSDKYYSKYYTENIDNCPQINSGKIAFMDTAPRKLKLIKLRKEANKRYSIANIEYFEGNYSHKINNYCTVSEIQIKEEYEKEISKSFIIRLSNLDEGYYAFYTQKTQGDLIEKDSFQFIQIIT